MTIAISGAKVNVVGLGATGLSLVRFLTRRGAQVSVFDGKANASGLEVLRREFPNVIFSQHDVNHDALPESDWIALSPGVPRASYALASAHKAGKLIVGDIELFAKLNQGNKPVIAITGSNGKTTTAQLTGALIKSAGVNSAVVGNVGLPVLDALTESNADAFVLEVSSFQLESTESLLCDAATVLNVTDNHLDRYESFFDYAASKARIFTHAKRQIINRNDRWSSAMRRPAVSSVTFGMDRAENSDDYGVIKKQGEWVLARGDESIATCSNMQLRGAHNAANALAALALASTLTSNDEAMRRALYAFEGIAHRYQWLGRVGLIDVINDSKATTVVAASAALDGTATPVWLVAGGDGKGQSFAALAEAATKCCRAAHLIGRDAPAIAAAMSDRGVPHRIFSSLDDAVHAALDQAQPGDTLLLSPACASWDMFKNYEARAHAFAVAVNAWAQARGLNLVKEPGHA